MPRSPYGDPEFRREVARKLADAISRQGLKRVQAAKELGISRQALHQYLAGRSTPRGEVLARAVAKWDIELEYRGGKFAAAAFQVRSAGATPEAVQMGLFEALQRLEDGNLAVKISSKRQGVLELKLQVRLAG